MGRKAKPIEERVGYAVIRVPVTRAQNERWLRDVDESGMSAAAFGRYRLLPLRREEIGPDVADPGHWAAQDGPSAPIGETPAPPQPPPKEEILLPPPGTPDGHGWHLRWNPRSPTVGTLSMAKAGDPWKCMDLIGVELVPQPDGWTLLRYADRSLIRTEEVES